jgi:hypothetical protein
MNYLTGTGMCTYDVLELLVPPPTRIGSTEMLVSGDYSLTGGL